jgi:hypothetical protein
LEFGHNIGINGHFQALKNQRKKMYSPKTKVEIASGQHPYGKWKTPFEQLKQVIQEPAPTVDRKLGYSDSFHEFVALWYVCL